MSTAKQISTPSKTRSLQGDVIKILLIERQWTYKDLASRCGFSTRTLSSGFARNFPQALTRYKVEKALDYFPIWSDSATLEKRKRCLAVFGLDPCVAGYRELDAKAGEMGVHFPAGISKERRVEIIFARLAALPQPKPQTNPSPVPV